MFTGIVEDVGRVSRIRRKQKESVFTFEVGKIDIGEVELGESIAVNGACLTVTSIGKRSFTVDASHETLDKTNLGELETGSSVNLERCLRADGKLGGHIVNGHVDGVGSIVGRAPEGESHRFSIRVPDDLCAFIAEKGSVTVDGVSLTVNEVDGAVFGVNIIPHTIEHTTFADRHEGDPVNLEIDMLARYVARLVEVGNRD